MAINLANPAKWQIAAIKSARSLIAKYRLDLEVAVSNNQFEEQVRIACAISGTRKGMLELGFLDAERDGRTIEMIDQLSKRARDICSNTSAS